MAPVSRPSARPPLRQDSKTKLSQPQTSTGVKPSVAPPTNISKFFIMLIMHICKRILFVNTSVKLGIYLVGVTVGSIITDIVPFPRTYFADKNNVFNIYFVKWGWGWTLILLGCFTFVTSMVYTCGDLKAVRRHLLRLAVSTGFWFICVKTFEYIEYKTGMCTSTEFTDKQSCRKAKYMWIGFDISGHTFLLMHCLLTISEEVKCINGWEKIADIIKVEEEKPSERFTRQELTKLKVAYQISAPALKILVVLLTILTIMWEMMLVATTLYFHNLPQKVVAAVIAMFAWFLSYNVFYYMPFSPGFSGQGFFKYMK